MNKKGSDFKLCGMLGLAARGRMLSCGAELACDAIRSGNAKLVLIAFDASSNTKKRVFNCSKYYETACYEINIGQSEIGHAIGKTGATAALSVNDRNMAKGIEKLLNQINAQQSEADIHPREV